MEQRGLELQNAPETVDGQWVGSEYAMNLENKTCYITCVYIYVYTLYIKRKFYLMNKIETSFMKSIIVYREF